MSSQEVALATAAPLYFRIKGASFGCNADTDVAKATAANATTSRATDVRVPTDGRSISEAPRSMRGQGNTRSRDPKQGGKLWEETY